MCAQKKEKKNNNKLSQQYQKYYNKTMLEDRVLSQFRPLTLKEAADCSGSQI